MENATFIRHQATNNRNKLQLIGIGKHKLGTYVVKKTVLAYLRRKYRALAVAQPRILFGRGHLMTSSVTVVVLSPTVPSVSFPRIENWYKPTVKIIASFFHGGPWPLRPHSEIRCLFNEIDKR